MRAEGYKKVPGPWRKGPLTLWLDCWKALAASECLRSCVRSVPFHTHHLSKGQGWREMEASSSVTIVRVV